MTLNRIMVGLFVVLSGCVHRPPPPSPEPPKFVVGDGYQSQGEWLYPRAFANYDVTGLATVITDHTAPYTANNETYDPDALAAASPVLQLPAIVTVTNLENGESMDVRVNERGPDDPGRVLAVTPKVASLLGFPASGPVEVEVVLNSQQTDALDATLGQGPKMSAAPEAGITAQSLGPPGAAGSGVTQNLTPQDTASSAADPGQLSGRVTVTTPEPGPLFVQIPGFGRAYDAHRVMNQLGGLPARTVPVFGGDRTLYAIRIGPYENVSDADAALQQVLQDGVAGPEIIVR
ncbi:MAG: RlpA-like double-psi beta-barrel domain-containing protein [Acidocella sp.]|nr:RlpA-like double-psi beta-barrel domain-containing protein [Acidocella sp.]